MQCTASVTRSGSRAPCQGQWLEVGGPPQPSEPVGRAGSIVHSLGDGIGLRGDFQRGRSKNRKMDGVHRCGVLLKSGRVCGSWQRAPAKCPNMA